MTAPFGPGYPYQASFQTTPGVYGSMPTLPNSFYPTPLQPLDRFQRQQAPSNQNPQPWYAKAGKELLKTGIVIGASVLGGLVGNVPGAMAAGATAAGVVSMADQKWSQGKINWGTTAVDTAIGLIPAGLGNGLVKGLQSVLGKKLFETAGQQTVKQVIAKGASIGALDGAAFGYASGTAHSAMESYQQTGQVNWSQANQSGLHSLLPGAFGGAIAGGALTGVVRHYSGKSGEKSYTKAEGGSPTKSICEIPAPTAEELKTLKPPRRTWFNRAISKLSLRSEDAKLGNFHKVDNQVLRGAMPESVEAIAHLKDHHGVKTIIDLRGAGTTQNQYIQFERGHTEAQGLRYTHLPMDSHVPPNRQQLELFLNAVQETQQAGGKVYVHCKHGIDRTGVLVAAYEVLTGKTQAAAYKNMKQYGFNKQHQWSRPHQKDFVLGQDLPTLLDGIRPDWRAR